MIKQAYFEVPKLTKALQCSVEVPGSKSITNRALLIAALAEEPVLLHNVLFSDDSRNFIGCLKTLGFKLDVDEPAKRVKVYGKSGEIPNRKAQIYVGSAGTAARFITAMLALAEGEYTVEASAQMISRPMKPLLDALVTLGARFEYLGNAGCLPFKIFGTTSRGRKVTLKANISSQFLSALLLAGCNSTDALEILIDSEIVAQPFVEMSIAMMRQFGVEVHNNNFQQFLIPAGQKYHGKPEYFIEPDVSNANYFFAMATITGGSVLVKGVKLGSLQGDIKILEILKELGSTVEEKPDGVLVTGPRDGVYPGIEVDLGAMPDQTMTIAALAPFASDPTIIRNIGFIKHHESNRLQAIINEMTRMGIRCEETGDGLIIYPGLPKPVAIETYDDHRMAMAFALIGLRVPGMKIINPECTAKTFENYFNLLAEIL